MNTNIPGGTTLLNFTKGQFFLNGRLNHLGLALGVFLGLSMASSDSVRASNEGGLAEESSQPINGNEACLVIIGASYAGAWDIDELLGCGVINKGIDGNQSFEMRQRFDEDVIAEQPQIVLIWGFINDIFRADPDKMEAALRRIRESFEAMVANAKSHGIEPILATEVTIRERAGWDNWLMGMLGRIMGKTSYQSFINGHVMATNSWLREYAANQGLQLLDFEQVLASADGSRQARFAQDDGSHLTAAAYQAMTGYARKELSR